MIRYSALARQILPSLATIEIVAELDYFVDVNTLVIPIFGLIIIAVVAVLLPRKAKI